MSSLNDSGGRYALRSRGWWKRGDISTCLARCGMECWISQDGGPDIDQGPQSLASKGRKCGHHVGNHRALTEENRLLDPASAGARAGQRGHQQFPLFLPPPPPLLPSSLWYKRPCHPLPVTLAQYSSSLNLA